MHCPFNSFWRDGEKSMLRHAQTFDQLADVAMIVLSRIFASSQGQVAIVCGPISTGGLGSKYHNLALFRGAIRLVAQKGVCVFDQMPFEDKIAQLSQSHTRRGEYCHEILSIFYGRLYASALITQAIFLPDWKTSTGSSWERQHLCRIGIKIQDFPEEWLTELEQIKQKVQGRGQ